MNHHIEYVTPVFPVTNLKRSVAFYQRVLGFSLDWDNGTICGVSRDEHSLLLSEQGESEGPGVAWISFDVDELMSRKDELELRVVEGPVNNSWAYQVKVADPDGNLLWLACDPKETTS